MFNETDRILLIGHGSPKSDANNIEVIGKLLHWKIHPFCNKECVKVAYLQFGEPDLMAAIEKAANTNVKRLIIYPFFLSSGLHVTRDIPELIEKAKERFPSVEFLYPEPIGIHEKLVDIVIDRISSIIDDKGYRIEKRSFEIISEEEDLSSLPSEHQPILKRVIHATADFEYKNTLIFHPEAVKRGIKAIQAGQDILTDVEMVRAGINKSLLKEWGGKAICNIQNIENNNFKHATRAERAIEEAIGNNNNIGIIAIGNAPTALLRVIDIVRNLPIENIAKPLVIGVPVGFIKAVEAKMLLSVQNFPYITNRGRKGGTPVAVAIVNALLKMSLNEK